MMQEVAPHPFPPPLRGRMKVGVKGFRGATPEYLERNLIMEPP